MTRPSRKTRSSPRSSASTLTRRRPSPLSSPRSAARVRAVVPHTNVAPGPLRCHSKAAHRVHECCAMASGWWPDDDRFSPPLVLCVAGPGGKRDEDVFSFDEEDIPRPKAQQPQPKAQPKPQQQQPKAQPKPQQPKVRRVSCVACRWEARTQVSGHAGPAGQGPAIGVGSEPEQRASERSLLHVPVPVVCAPAAAPNQHTPCRWVHLAPTANAHLENSSA